MSLPKRRARKAKLRDDWLAQRRGRFSLFRFLRFPCYVAFYAVMGGGAWTAYRTNDLLGGLSLAIAYLLVVMAMGLHGSYRWMPGFRGVKWKVERLIALAGYFVVLMLAFGYVAGRAFPSTPMAFPPVPEVAAHKENEPSGTVSSGGGGMGLETGRAAVPVFATGGDAEEGEGFYARVTNVPEAGVVTLDGTENVTLLGILSPAPDDPRYADAAEVLRALAQGKDVRVKLWAGGPESGGRTAGLVWVMGSGEEGDEFLLNTELVRMGYALLSPPPGAPEEIQVPGALPESGGGVEPGGEGTGERPIIPH